MIQQDNFWVYTQNSWKQGLEQVFNILIYIAVLFIVAKGGNNPNVYWEINE